jgi:hypothetical protein
MMCDIVSSFYNTVLAQARQIYIITATCTRTASYFALALRDTLLTVAEHGLSKLITAAALLIP